jgi:hypothetical protein
MSATWSRMHSPWALTWFYPITLCHASFPHFTAPPQDPLLPPFPKKFNPIVPRSATKQNALMIASIARAFPTPQLKILPNQV